MRDFVEKYFYSSDGVHRCRFLIVKPDAAPRAIVQISHGMCEHIERYLPFMSFLADNGFVVCGNDHLGHGKTAASQDELGYFSPEKGWQNAVRDLHRLSKLMKRDYPDLPLVLIGHSMGSFFARAYAVKYSGECAAFVFLGTSGGFENEVNEIRALVGKDSGVAKIAEKIAGKFEDKLGINDTKLGGAALALMLTEAEAIKKVKGDRYRSKTLDKIGFGRYIERVENPRTRYDWLSRDEKEIDEFCADTLCTFMFTVNGIINLASALWFVSSDKWYANMPKDIPLLLLSGTDDPVGSYGEGVKIVYSKLCAVRCDASLKLYEGARHELLHELNRDEVYADILAFIGNVLS